MQKHASAKHSSPLVLNYIVRLSLYSQGLPDGIWGIKHPEFLTLVVVIEREEKNPAQPSAWALKNQINNSSSRGRGRKPLEGVERQREGEQKYNLFPKYHTVFKNLCLLPIHCLHCH